ncbi:MAG TPA: DUF1194 domain-containing protein [Dongiaceae bacterium]|jgi:hypothetical protein
MLVRVLAILAALLSAASAYAQDEPAVDVALVLSVDASGSIDPNEFALQRDGIAGAVTDADVLKAIKGGIQGRIAIALVEWGTPGAPAPVVGWHLVGDDASAAAFASAVRAAPRAPQSWNAIGDGMELGIGMLVACPCKPTRKVIDVSGDNPDHRGQVSSSMARDEAVAAGITVNALAILNDDRKGPNGRPWLVEVYEQEVIGGFGAFVIPAETRADFARALRQKLIHEIASR